MLSNRKTLWTSANLRIFYRQTGESQGYWMLCYKDALKIGELQYFHFWKIKQRWCSIPEDEVDLA